MVSRLILPGSAALVQGVTGGIGLALAELLVLGGGQGTVYGTCRKVSKELAELESRSAVRLVLLDGVDLLREDSIAHAAATFKSRESQLNLLINASGTLHQPDGMSPERRVTEITPEAAAQSFAVNTIGPMMVRYEWSFVELVEHPSACRKFSYGSSWTGR